MPPAPLPPDDAAYAALVASFADGTIPFETWRHHRTHLIVALWHVHQYPAPEALDRMRAGILGILAANGIRTTPDNGYHETITAAWLRLLAGFLAKAPPAPLPALAEDAVAAFADQEILLRHYSRERILSPEARAAWVEPDIEALPVPAMITTA